MFLLMMPSVCGLGHDALWRGMPYIALSSFPLSLIPNDCGIPGGALQDSTLSHTIDTSSHHDAERAGADFRMTRGQAARELLSVETFLGRVLSQAFEENLLLFAG